MKNFFVIAAILFNAQRLAVKAKICNYGGYCLSNDDCFEGSSCAKQNQYYSQCVPQAANTCVGDYQQCGGINKAPYCCASSTCVFQNAYYSQCIPNACTYPSGFATQSVVPSVKPVTTNPSFRPSSVPSTYKSPSPTGNPVPVPSSSPVSSKPTKSPVSYSGLICQYSGYCRTSADCVPGNKCNVQSAYYSQCIPDSSSYLTANCIANYAIQCSDSTQCCDPGAYCNDANFRQCQQPPQNSAMCLTLYSYPAKSTSPTKSPSVYSSAVPTSLVPSAAPSTSFPTAAAPLTISYTVNQTFSNVTCQAFNTEAAKTAFIATVAQTLNISPSSVILVTVVCNNGGRRRLAAASGPSVTVIYSVSYNTVKSVEEDRSILTGSVISGAFTSALRENAASAGATALLSAISTTVSVVDTTTTTTPSAVPSSAPSPVPSKTPTSDPSSAPSAVLSDAPQANLTAPPSEAPTGAPVTGAPMTMSPMTDAPATMAPMTGAPFTMAPMTGAPM